MRLAFIDTETTGLDPKKHEIIEIAVLIEEEGKVIDAFQSKIRPQRIEVAEPRALELNGYSKNSRAWENAPLMEEVAPILIRMLDGCILVGHNPSFDEAFLREGIVRAGVSGKIPYHKIDTITLAYEHLSPLGLTKASLDAIRDFLGWSKKNAHTAMVDVEDSRKLFRVCWRMGFFRKLKLRFSLASRKRNTFSS